ncbi:MAG: hypothetical protein EZS28_007102 [Streblomastix strix]|uniref:Uncharacterized protein n=1 Tax=Streblomastix strix TaxID=222440 RepID=A0A5J4WTB9_9EUKA|nr:MAG: hypothetical protein EZS28_007102 [Streblomastix strix]
MILAVRLSYVFCCSSQTQERTGQAPQNYVLAGIYSVRRCQVVVVTIWGFLSGTCVCIALLIAFYVETQGGSIRFIQFGSSSESVQELLLYKQLCKKICLSLAISKIFTRGVYILPSGLDGYLSKPIPKGSNPYLRWIIVLQNLSLLSVARLPKVVFYRLCPIQFRIYTLIKLCPHECQ